MNSSHRIITFNSLHQTNLATVLKIYQINGLPLSMKSIVLLNWQSFFIVQQSHNLLWVCEKKTDHKLLTLRGFYYAWVFLIIDKYRKQLDIY